MSMMRERGYWIFQPLSTSVAIVMRVGRSEVGYRGTSTSLLLAISLDDIVDMFEVVPVRPCHCLIRSLCCVANHVFEFT